MIKLTVHYTDAEMYGMVESTIKIYEYNPENLRWAPVETTLNESDNTATLTGLSLFAVGGIDLLN